MPNINNIHICMCICMIKEPTLHNYNVLLHYTYMIIVYVQTYIYFQLVCKVVKGREARARIKINAS